MTYTISGNIKAGKTVTERVPYPIRNLSSITSVTVSDADIQVRIAKNSVDFTDWVSGDSVSESIDQYQDPVIELRLTATTDVVDPEITISGAASTAPYSFLDLSETAYNDIDATSLTFERLWLNLFYKLYTEGIVPNFIDRDTDDYVSYFKYLAIVNALNIELAEQYLTKFDTNQNRILSYLEQKSLLICENASLSDLQQIKESTISILRKRGTYGIDEEIKIWLCIDDCTPFFLENAPRYLSGWTLDRSSPNYTGKEHYQMNAAPTKGPNIYASDGLTASGTVNYIQGDGLGFLLLEDGFRFLLESTDLDIDIDGDNLIIQYDTIRDIVCLGDAPLPKDFLVQDGGSDKITQENSGGILLERGGLSVGSEPYVEFDVCVNTSFEYELRFTAKADFGAGVRVEVYTDEAVLYANNPTSSSGDLPLPLSSFIAVPSVELPKSNKWTEFSIPIAPYNVPVTGTSGALGNEPNYLPEPRRHIPSGSFDQFWMADKPTKIVTMKVRIINPFSENLYLHKLSIGPTSVDNIGVRLDAYNETTLIYQDRVDIEDIDDVSLKTRKYLIPYGGTLYVEKIKKED